MCAICLSNPCRPGCPNAPEPIAVDNCYLCDAEILEGEEYYTVCDLPVCSGCAKTISIKQLMDITDMSSEEIICELGGERKVGEAD